MQARINQEGEVMVIHLSGRLDVETAEPFRDACLSHLNGKKVVFDFKSLNFVGSSGIIPFLEAMQVYASTNTGIFRFSGVGTEFRRVFAATPLHTVEIFETHVQAVDALLRPVIPDATTLVVQPVPLTDLSEGDIVDEDLARDQNHTEFGYLNLKYEIDTDASKSAEKKVETNTKPPRSSEN